MSKKEVKKKYVIAGCSGRALSMFAKPMQKTFSDYTDLVGIFDPNDMRMDFFNQQLETSTAMYTDFRKMLKEQQPDSMIVATTDCWHHKYIIAGLNAGLDVITEKPMTIDMKNVKQSWRQRKRAAKKYQ